MSEINLLLIFLIVVSFVSIGSMVHLTFRTQRNIVDQIKERGSVEIPYPDNHLTPFQGSKEIFVTFPCECKEQIVVEEFLMPGDIHVIDCSNCRISWSVYNPSLIIKQTKDLPDSLKTAVAQNMAQLNA